MGTKRERILKKEDIGRSYKLERNAVFETYKDAFRVIFEQFDGIPRAKHQANWYVGKRWNRRLKKYMPDQDAEERLLSFLTNEIYDSRRALRIVYGRTGCGKSTFLKYFFYSYLQNEHPDAYTKFAPIIIDCADAAVSPEMLEQDVDHRIAEVLKNSKKYKWLEEEPHYIKMWEEECDFDKLFYIRLFSELSAAETEHKKLEIIEKKRQNIHDFNRVRINYLIKHCGLTPVMVWDNLDHASLEVQRRAIQLARHKLSWMKGAKVVIAIREYAYPLVQQEIAPAAYLLSDQELYAPDIHQVLEKRVNAGVKALDNIQPNMALTNRFSIALANPASFIHTILESLKEREVEDALCSLSEDNIREQLLMIEQTFRSGHIPIEMIAEMIRSYSNGVAPTMLSWRRFIEGIICGDYRFHRDEGEDHSLLLNVYESGELSHDFCNSLCIPRILQIIDSFSTGITLQELFRALEIIGYPKLILRLCIDKLMKCNLVYSPQGLLDMEHMEKSKSKDWHLYYISLTSVGRYYLHRLIKEFVYVFHMSLVTSLEVRFLSGLKIWEPQEINKQAESAMALILQINHDEKSEHKVMVKTKEGSIIGKNFMFGRLAYDMTMGCREGIKNMWSAARLGGYENKINWRELLIILTPPRIIEI